MSQTLPIKTFKTIIKNSPLVSIDLIIQNKSGEYLLGLRKNRPAQNYWFVPGGRILKDETMSEAFKRLTMNELGRVYHIDDAEFLGPYEHFYSDNMSGEDFSTHYIALGYRLRINTLSTTLPVEQHVDFKWMPKSDLLNNPTVHKHSQWYFKRL